MTERVTDSGISSPMTLTMASHNQRPSVDHAPLLKTGNDIMKLILPKRSVLTLKPTSAQSTVLGDADALMPKVRFDSAIDEPFVGSVTWRIGVIETSLMLKAKMYPGSSWPSY